VRRFALTGRKSGTGRCNGQVIGSLNRKFGLLQRGHLARRCRSYGPLKQLLSESNTYDRGQGWPLDFGAVRCSQIQKLLPVLTAYAAMHNIAVLPARKLGGTLHNRTVETEMNWRKAKGECFRRLWSAELSTFRDHLMRLDQESRYARFSTAVSDHFFNPVC
jgi:hypothetical protein